MTLLGAILERVKSKESVTRKYASPPPEIDEFPVHKRKKLKNKYAHVKAVVDCSPLPYDPSRLVRNLPLWRQGLRNLTADNCRMIVAIRMAHLSGGKVDCHWKRPLPQNNIHYYNRVNFLKNLRRENLALYKRICESGPRITSTASLRRDWIRNRREILLQAQNKFVLFPPVPTEVIEDAAFLPAPGVKRPRVHLKLGFRGGATLGELSVELFEEVCPLTCRLFLELLDGDGLGHGYVGTTFFRKVPGLYWSGGDVVHDNGFGCYAQRGRRFPIGSENYHFPHSMPGLLSMRVTPDDEVCGIFNITFKPLPQFELRNVVFGRIIRPSGTYDTIRSLGSALSTWPVIELVSSRRFVNRVWRHGVQNSKLMSYNRRIKKET